MWQEQSLLALPFEDLACDENTALWEAGYRGHRGCARCGVCQMGGNYGGSTTYHSILKVRSNGVVSMDGVGEASGVELWSGAVRLDCGVADAELGRLE